MREREARVTSTRLAAALGGKETMRRNKGFTLIELLVVIAIIAILAAILFPVFAAARERGRQASCLSNVKQIALAIVQYSNDYKGYWPYCVDFEDKNNRGGEAAVQSAPYLWEVLASYTKGKEVWRCPGDKGIKFQKAGPITAALGVMVVKKCCDMYKLKPGDAVLDRLYVSYTTNYSMSYYPDGVPKPIKLDQAPNASRAMAIFDPWQVSNWNLGPQESEWNGQWHSRKYPQCSWNVGFLDGHARSLTFKEIRYPSDAPDANGAKAISLFDDYYFRT